MSRNRRGDTIVEVLFAIAIAAFGIGITYATAQRGINQTITAREHNEAQNLIDNQLTELRLRYASDPVSFETKFGSPNTHFCLDDTMTYPNTGPNGPASQNLSTASDNPKGPYDKHCAPQKLGDGVQYFIDIQTSPLHPPITVNPTLYQVFVRWQPLTGSEINQVSTYFRINGGQTSLGS